MTEQERWEQEDQIVNDIRTRFPNQPWKDVSKSPLWHGVNKDQRVKGQDAIIGEVPNEDPLVYGIASNSYRIVPHEVATHLMLEEMKKFPELGEPELSFGFINDGAKFHLDALFPQAEKHEVAVGEPIGIKIETRNSHDLGWLFRVSFGALILKCTNGMTAFKVNKKISKRHTMALEPETIIEKIGEGIQIYSEQLGIWQSWARKQLNPAEFEPIWDALPFGKNHREEILALPHIQTGETLTNWITTGSINAWNLNGIVTQFLTHNIESEMVRLDKSDEVARIMHTRLQSLS